MTNLQQIKKNIRLSSKIAKYLISNPKEFKNFPKKVSIIPISINDKDLNEMNSKMIDALKSKGKNVIEAKETKNKSKPWQFAFL